MIDTEFKVKRYITEFSNNTDELIAKYDLEFFELKQFQLELCDPKFCESKTQCPMFACYPIKKRNLEFLKKYLAQEPEWDFVNNSYFLEACNI